MRLADVDWIPAASFFKYGVRHFKNQYATFKTDFGRMHVELFYENKEVIVLVTLNKAKTFPRHTSKFRCSGYELAVMLRYGNARQNERWKKESYGDRFKPAPLPVHSGLREGPARGDSRP